ncbi:MAG: hypothetical protein IMW96_01405 [Thermoanaerobacteraceae bacterium]|nr:hypothetical protein [Thermoanaerobacteraceae bacterium]
MEGRCPGQDRRCWKPEDIFEEPCPHCGGPIEFWKDDVTVRCPHCRQRVTNPRFDPGCAAWCSYAHKCLGEIALTYQRQPRVLRDKLEVEARKNYLNNKQLLNVALKSAGWAEKLAREEGVEPLVAIAACLFYDLGGAGGGPDAASRARQIMAAVPGLEPAVIQEVAAVIAAGEKTLDLPAWRVVQDARRLARLTGDPHERPTFYTAASQGLAAELTGRSE